MLEARVLQYELFTDTVCEVAYDSVRYVLRRNPARAEQISMTREAELESVQKIVKECNNYLTEHPRATVAVALKKVHTRIKKLKVEKWLNATVTQRVITIEKDQSALEQAALLDGCYAIELSGGTGFFGKNTSVRRGGLKTAESRIFYRRAARRYKAAIEVPLILVGGIRSLEVAETLVAERKADYVALSRPLICEPNLNRRWQAGNRRPSRCLSDNLCFKPALRGEGIYCVTAAQHREKASDH